MEKLERLLASIGDYATLVVRVIYICFRSPPQWKLIRDQMFDVGVMSLPVVAITGFSTGMVLAAQQTLPP